MLASYAKGVEAMLKLPADHPQNWFRNAFIHLMDCPHGNWWFYVWHRGYVGYFERTIRESERRRQLCDALLGLDSAAADSRRDVRRRADPDRTPPSSPTRAISRSSPSFMKPALTTYWNGLSAAQHAQLNARGYTSLRRPRGTT